MERISRKAAAHIAALHRVILAQGTSASLSDISPTAISAEVKLTAWSSGAEIASGIPAYVRDPNCPSRSEL